MERIGSIGVLAIAFAFVVTPGEAQTQTTKAKKGQQMTQNQQIEARHQCFLEAQAAVPGAAIGGGEMNQRTAVYTSCTARKGVRP
jgi:hypothetical protein